MKRVVQTLYYDTANLEAHGFKTDAQKRAVACVGELLEEITNSPAPFGMMLFFITEADLLGNMPVTIWSGFTDAEKLRLFEDYVQNRIRLKEQSTEPTRAP